jgi:hypothetical protein
MRLVVCPGRYETAESGVRERVADWSSLLLRRISDED